MNVAVADGSGAMFDAIARRYDLLNRITSFGLDAGWRRKAADALELAPGSRVLDLATGTADLAIEIATRAESIRVVGLDASQGMLDIGARKIAAVGLGDRIQLEHGDAGALAFLDESFDRASIAFGIRNMPDRGRVLEELARVLKPGGIVVILELSMPERGLLAPFARFHIRQVVPRLGAVLSGEREYRHLERSIAAFPQPDAFAALIAQKGFTVSAVRPLTFGVAVLYVARKGGTP